MISEDDVRKIAKLARLRLAPEEIAKYQAQLLHILESMKELKELDVTGVAPTTSVLGVANVMGEDEPKPFAAVEKLLALSPEREGPYFRVKKVMGE